MALNIHNKRMYIPQVLAEPLLNMTLDAMLMTVF